MICSICHVRKEKRFCPAVHGRICPQCCGEQREVTLDCPSECPYLQQARAHEKPRDLSEADREALFPTIEVGERFIYEHEHLIVGLSFALAKSVRQNRALVDQDLTAALAAMAKSYQTLVNSSLIYGQTTTNLAHQAVAREVETMIKEYRETEQKHLGYSRLRDSDVLKALVFTVRLATNRTSGRPKSRAFVDWVLQQLPEQPAAIVSPKETGNRIIVP